MDRNPTDRIMKKLPEAEIKKYHPIRLPSKLVDRLAKWRRFLTYSKNASYTYETLIHEIFQKEPHLSIKEFYKQRDEKEKWEKEQENLRRRSGVEVKKKEKVQYKCINLPIEQVEKLAERRKSLMGESGRNTTWEEMFLYYIDKYLSYHSDLADYESSKNYIRNKR